MGTRTSLVGTATTLAVVAALGACEDQTPPELGCRSDADCELGQHCQERTLSGVPPKTLMVPPTECGNPMRPCSDALCGENSICPTFDDFASTEDPIVTQEGSCTYTTAPCAPPCPSTGCGEGKRCEDDGHCQLLPCTDAACPSGYECNAELAQRAYTFDELEEYYEQWSINFAYVADVDTTSAINLYRRGCLPSTCGEDAGVSCIPDYECNPDADAGGWTCVPLPCEETGLCASSAYICEPQSDNPRRSGTDAHGCVRRNCEEDLLCAVYEVCDFSRTNADPETGCALLACDERNGLPCGPEESCAPERSTVELRGCAPALCTEQAYSCGEDSRCAPEAPEADLHGCVEVVAGNEAKATPTDTPDASSSGALSGGAAMPDAGSTTDASASDLSAASGRVGVPQSSAEECASDEDCEGEFCVLGRCSKRFGVCVDP